MGDIYKKRRENGGNALLYAAEGRTPRVYPWMNELFNEPLGSEATFGA